jgi:hypothetical protein
MRYLPFLFVFIVAGSSSTEQLFHPKITYHAMDVKMVETVTDSTKPADQMSTTEKMNGHIVHFTGAVMSDTIVVSHFSRAFVNDQYSDFLKPGKYPKGNICLPKSIASSLDGIAIPQKTRLIIYDKPNYTGTKMMDVTGPAIVNNSIWQTSGFYSEANSKKYSRGLQDMFPPTVRKWSSRDMSYLQDFSIEIMVIP